MGGCLEGVAPRPLERPKQVTLKYFPLPGRAEPIRLILTLGDITFFDHRISRQEWEEEKQHTPFGQVPVLIVDKKQIAQTKAILRYVGKFTKHEGRCLYPSDPYLAAKVDELVDAFEDIWIFLAPTYRFSDQEQREQARQLLFAPEGQATIWVKIFERTLEQSTDGFVVPGGLTIADIVLFCYFNVIRSTFIEGLGPNLFRGYTRIMQHKEMMAKLPAIERYYKDRRSNPECLKYYDVFMPGQ
mmetsp:Transcript_9769/g.27245  ORF Transcript_9769/g.27245 Transcript_9769/m.27245 type:complete len:243 (-) Transcript_9769:120-848(-)